MAEVQKTLDHKLLNKVEALGPPTLENLSRFIWERVQHAGKLARVSVHRDSCNESCTYFGPQGVTSLRERSEAIHRARAKNWIARRFARNDGRLRVRWTCP